MVRNEERTRKKNERKERGNLSYITMVEQLPNYDNCTIIISTSLYITLLVERNPQWILLHMKAAGFSNVLHKIQVSSILCHFIVFPYKLKRKERL